VPHAAQDGEQFGGHAFSYSYEHYLCAPFRRSFAESFFSHIFESVKKKMQSFTFFGFEVGKAGEGAVSPAVSEAESMEKRVRKDPFEPL
jgi:hypothetical protein